MIILILILIGVAIFGLTAGYFYNRNIQKKIERGELEDTRTRRLADAASVQTPYRKRWQ